MLTREACEALDRTDPLKDKRDLFALPEGEIYLDGNSLGVPPRAALARLREASPLPKEGRPSGSGVCVRFRRLG